METRRLSATLPHAPLPRGGAQCAAVADADPSLPKTQELLVLVPDPRLERTHIRVVLDPDIAAGATCARYMRTWSCAHGHGHAHMVMVMRTVQHKAHHAAAANAIAQDHGGVGALLALPHQDGPLAVAHHLA